MARARADGPPPEPLASTCDCPRLDPADWHDVESDWSDIAFVQTSTTAVLGVPVGFAGLRAGLLQRARNLGATVPEDAMLLLGEGRFRRPAMLEVEGAKAGQRGFTFPGGFAYSRLLNAPWGQIGAAAAQTLEAARERYGRDPHQLWIWYLTCRVCSEERTFETLFLAHYQHALRP